MDERFGFIHEKLDIKILILYILRRLPEPVTFDTLGELTLCDEGISYFDFAECVSELVSTEHIKTDGHTYSLTDKGIKNADITENSIPFSVRAKAEKSSSDLRFQLNRKAMITSSHSIRRKGGYTVDLSLSDGISDIISLKLYAVNQAQAQALEDGFTKNAEDIYNKIIRLILDDK